MQTTDPKPVLDDDRLYLGDNGRCFCGRLRCAGSSSHFTGRDISGQEVYPVGAQDVAWAKSKGFVLKCESCGKEAK